MRPMRISILNWTGDRPNWGCQATSFGLLDDLREALGEAPVEFHFVPLGEKVAADRRVRLLDPWLRRSLAGRGSPGLVTLAGQAIYGEALLSRLRQADVVVFMAEGTMTGLNFFEGSRLLLLPWLAAEMGKPVLSLNQSVFSAAPGFEPAMRATYAKFRMVALREPASLAYMRELGFSEAFLFADSAFRTEPSEMPLAELVAGEVLGPLLCLTGSGGHSGLHQSPPMEAAAAFARDNGLQVCALTWNPSVAVEMESVVAKVGGLPPLRPKPGIGYRDVSALLAQSFALVGGRYHTAIQAATVGTPFVSLPSGTHKTRGLHELLRYTLPCHALDDAQGVLDSLSRIKDDRHAFSALLAEGTLRIRQERHTALKHLRKALLG
ncbi:MAG: polysaccharide pyruvyl transferase family protein [Fimbriimonadaceae bacterium]|nr:polysaccharide pyruvyl transferase family protein [Fimbriimonadaceae bacterium]QYK54871.1 MAG: polysaccharide pyruvyl transferase family protein [Fimbriimonadaceae bacterium]